MSTLKTLDPPASLWATLATISDNDSTINTTVINNLEVFNQFQGMSLFLLFNM